MIMKELLVLQLLISSYIVLSDIKIDNKHYFYNYNSFNNGQKIPTNTTVEDIKTSWYQKPMNKVNIKILYETLCPGSILFFTKQLKPIVKKFGSYLNIHLIPYGFATLHKMTRRSMTPEIECHHGPMECYGNKVHACAIKVLQNMTMATLYNTCLLENRSYNLDWGLYFNTFRKCNIEMQIPRPKIGRIFNCAGGREGYELLKKFGEQTSSIKPSYLPYVLINNRTLSNLQGAICYFLQPKPKQCYH